MNSWPRSFRGTRVTQLGAVLATTKLLAVPAAAGANTKGSWVEVSASAPFDACGFYLQFGGFAVTTQDLLLDIGVGAGGSEQVILSNLPISVGTGFVATAVQPFIPLAIKAGQRIAARIQSSAASGGVELGLHLSAGDFFSQLGLGRATTYGANTADSGGVSVDPGGVINTKGAWSEISASITNPIRYMLICVGSQANAVISSSNNLLDIGVGAAAAEQVVINNIALIGSGGPDLYEPGIVAMFVSVAAGQRLSARKQCTITDATDRLNDIVIVGFD